MSAKMAKMPEFSAPEEWRKCAACKEQFDTNNNFNQKACIMKHPHYESHGRGECPICSGWDAMCSYCVRCRGTVAIDENFFICFAGESDEIFVCAICPGPDTNEVEKIYSSICSSNRRQTHLITI